MVFGYFMVCFTHAMVDGTYGTIIESFTEKRTGHIQIHKETYIDNPTIYKTINTQETESILSKN